jgi:hypothetical protein
MRFQRRGAAFIQTKKKAGPISGSGFLKLKADSCREAA